MKLLLGPDGAAYKGNLDEVKRLIHTGATGETEYAGSTALLWAAIGKQSHVVKWLLREGGFSITERDGFGHTALLMTVFSIQVKPVQFLLLE